MIRALARATRWAIPPDNWLGRAFSNPRRPTRSICSWTKACLTLRCAFSRFIVYFGGLFGNRIAVGRQLWPIIFSTEELHQVIEATLAFFEKHGKASERFGTMLDRVGWDLLEKELGEVLA